MSESGGNQWSIFDFVALEVNGPSVKRLKSQGFHLENIVFAWCMRAGVIEDRAKSNFATRRGQD